LHHLATGFALFVKNDLDLSGSPTTAVSRAPFRDDFVSPGSLGFLIIPIPLFTRPFRAQL
jgi:hypothetical protein